MRQEQKPPISCETGLHDIDGATVNQKIGPGTFFVTLLFAAMALGGLYLGNTRANPPWFSTDYSPVLLAVSKYAFEGCIAFGALYLYLPARTTAETLRKAWTEGFVQMANDLLGRAEAAREALVTLARVGSTTPDQLPSACSAEFSEVASYCAGWRTRERRRYWNRTLASQLDESNRALFDFVLTLEISNPPQAAILKDKLAAALNSLDGVIDHLRKLLQIPD